MWQCYVYGLSNFRARFTAKIALDSILIFLNT